MSRNFINKELNEIIKKIKQQKVAYIFLDKIDNIIANFPSYKEIIKNPIDLSIIEQKVFDKQYSQPEQFEFDINLMLENCRVFNQNCTNFIKVADTLQNYFNNHYSRTEAKIKKFLEKNDNKDLGKMSNKNNMQGDSFIGSNYKANIGNNSSVNNNSMYGMIEGNKILNGNNTNQNDTNILNNSRNIQNTSIQKNIPILGSTEEEKIYEKIFNMFMKVQPELGIEENKLEEQISSITKALVKRNKSFDLIYEEAVNFLNTHIKNKEDKETKTKFLKKFRKLVKTIKDDHNNDSLKMNIKIKLNQNNNFDKIKDHKEIIENAIKITQDFLDNQNVPVIFRDLEEFPIE